MVSANDPIESFFSSIQMIKEVFSPVESGLRKAAKDLECCWAGPKKKEISVEQNAQHNHRNCKSQSSGVVKKSGYFLLGDEKKKGSSTKIPIKSFFGKFSQNSKNGNQSEVSNGRLKDAEIVKEDPSRMNFLHFAVTWSLLVKSIVQAFPDSFKPIKKRIQKTVVEDKLNSSSKKKQYQSITNDKEGKHVSFKCFISHIFDQLNYNLQKFDNLKKPTDRKEDREEKGNGFLGNLMFARVGGLPSTVVGVSSSVNEEGDDGPTPENIEESGGISPQKLAGGILSIPLSNVERLKSTLSTVTLSELIELLPQLGKSTKAYPDKKKLI